MHIKKSKHLTTIKIFIIVSLFLTTVLPVFEIFSYALKEDIGAIIFSELFITAAKNSLIVALTATVIVLLFATIFAFAVTRSQIRTRNFFVMWVTIPMLVPSISHGMGLIILLGNNGLLTSLFKMKSIIYGFGGMILGAVMYTLPIAFLMISDVMAYENEAPYEAATILGIPKWRQCFSITLPYLVKPLISVAFAVFTMIITDYGVPMILGGQHTTLATMMYHEVIGLLNFNKGSILGMALILPAIIAFLVDLLQKNKEDNTTSIKKSLVKSGKVTKIVSNIYCIVISFITTLPVTIFALLSFVKKYPMDKSLSFNNIVRSLDLGVGQYLFNSVMVSIAVAIIGSIVSYVCGYLTARTSGVSSRLLYLFSIISMSIPGIVLGLSYVLFWNQSWIYGTFAILILVNFTHFFSSPFLMAHNSLRKVNKNIEAIGSVMGVSRYRIIKDVILPQSAATIIEMFVYFFVNSMMTISAVSFLTTVKTMQVALMIPKFEAQMLIECSAFVSLLILICNVFMKLIALATKKIFKLGDIK